MVPERRDSHEGKDIFRRAGINFALLAVFSISRLVTGRIPDRINRMAGSQSD
jgi:hypothetical protein